MAMIDDSLLWSTVHTVPYQVAEERGWRSEMPCRFSLVSCVFSGVIDGIRVLSLLLYMQGRLADYSTRYRIT